MELGLTPRPADVVVFPEGADIPPYGCAGAVTGIAVEPDKTGVGEWVTLSFEMGGSLHIYTTARLLWVAPDPH